MTDCTCIYFEWSGKHSAGCPEWRSDVTVADVEKIMRHVEGVQEAGFKREKEPPQHDHLTREIRAPESCHACALTHLGLRETATKALLASILQWHTDEEARLRRLADKSDLRSTLISKARWHKEARQMIAYLSSVTHS